MSSNILQSRAPGAQDIVQENVAEAVLPEVPGPEVLSQVAGERVVQQDAAPGMEYFNSQFARMQDATDMLNEQALANRRELRKGRLANSVAPIKSAAGLFLLFFFAGVLYCLGK